MKICGMKYRWIFILFILCFLNINKSLADINCVSYDEISLTMALNESLNFVGEDLPVGSEIYRAHMAKSAQVGVSCDADTYSLTNYLGVSYEPLGPATTMSTPYGVGSVYPTNLPSVGVMLWSTTYRTGTQEVIIIGTNQQSYSVYDQDTVRRRFPLNVSFIKLGEIPSGSIIDASLLPNVSWRIPSTPGYTGLPIRMATATFNGLIQLPSQTCTPLDSSVEMGTYNANEEFKSVGSYSKWVDASITLQNCPTFSGYYGNGGQHNIVSDETGGEIISTTGHTEGGTKASNLFSVSIIPYGNTVNTEGIISLDDIPNSATGIGLQLGYSDDLSASPLTPEHLWMWMDEWKITAPSDGRSTIKIPLAARYYQTDKEVTAGIASAKIMYTISYE